MCPLVPIRNYSNQLSFYIDDSYTSITSITHATTHHYINESSQLFILSLSDHSSSDPCQENTALINIWPTPSRIHIWLKIPSYKSPSIWRPNKYYTNPAFPTKNTACYFPLLPTVHISTIQHARFPPIIYSITSITLNTSTHHPIKTHHNSQPS